MRDLLIEFYLPRLHKSRPDGRQILQMICDLLPELAPEIYNSCEPINKKFDNVETALDDWGSSFIWKRKKPSAFGMVTFGSAHPRRPFHTSLLLEGMPETVSTNELVSFVQNFSVAFQPDIGFVHVFPKVEHEKKQPILNMSSFVMRESLPNLYWLTVFGRPYIELFGKDRLLSTPAALVKALAGDIVYIQLSEDVMDNRSQPEHVEAVRMTAKKYLDSNVFLDPELGPNHTYRTPGFQIQK